MIHSEITSQRRYQKRNKKIFKISKNEDATDQNYGMQLRQS